MFDRQGEDLREEDVSREEGGGEQEEAEEGKRYGKGDQINITFTSLVLVPILTSRCLPEDTRAQPI